MPPSSSTATQPAASGPFAAIRASRLPRAGRERFPGRYARSRHLQSRGRSRQNAEHQHREIRRHRIFPRRTSVLRAAATDNPLAAEGKAALDADHGTFTAFIAMYPVCGESVRSTFNVPVLILIGDADQRASPEACQRLAGHPHIGGGPVTFKLYPGATHSFDVEKPDRKTKFGDTLRFSADATADARERIKAFWCNICRNRNARRTQHAAAFSRRVAAHRCGGGHFRNRGRLPSC